MRKSLIIGVLGVLALLLFVPQMAAAAGPDVVITTPYTWVVTEKGKTISLFLDVNNTGAEYQTLDLQIADAPESWKPLLKEGGFTVKRIIVAPGKAQSISFTADLPADAKAADYPFSIKALSGSTVVSDLKLMVTLADKVGKGLTFTTQFPNIRGQAGNAFSYKLDLKNDVPEDRAVNFTAVAPDGWEVTFKPAYDTKQVSTIRVKAGESQGVDVDVTPPQKVEAGEYDLKLVATAGSDRAEVPLKATVLGNYKLSLGTPTGQLNAKATIEQPTNSTMIVKNIGASTMQNISLSASKPDGWDVTFSPEKIETLQPNEAKEVTVAYKPGSRTIVGDYMVSITASASQTSDYKDIRVSVETPTTWGFAGIAVIVVVLGGLGLLFSRLSRR